MRRIAIAAAVTIGATALAIAQPASSQTEDGWVTLVEGSNMGDWDKVGDAN